MTDRIAKAFCMSGAIQAEAPDISKAFERDWHAHLPRYLKSCGIPGLISV